MTTPFETDQPANAPGIVVLPPSGLHAIKSRLHLSMTHAADAPILLGSGMPVTKVASSSVLLMPDLALPALRDPALSGARLTLTPALPGDRLMLEGWRSDSGQGFSSPSGRITGQFSNGTLILIGLAALAEYQGLLRSAAHAHDGTAAEQPRSIEVTVTDADPVAPVTIPVATVTLDPVADLPGKMIAAVVMADTPATEAPDAVVAEAKAPLAPQMQSPLPEAAKPLTLAEDSTHAAKTGETTLTGSDGDDHLSTAGMDRILALGGDDIIELAEGTAADIIIDGGSGEDVILLTEKATDLAPVTDEQIVDVETVSAVTLELAAIIDMNAQSEGFSILGGSGNDRLKGGRSDDFVHGGAGDDRIDGGKGDDALHGGAGDDRIDGDDGDDWISGGAGRDDLTGGDGKDVFHFDGNDADRPDIITDFRPGDRIALTGSAYLQGLSNETLETGSWFWQGATAQNSDTRILYDKDSGYLIYASDGDGEGSSYIRIARLGDDGEDSDDCSAAQLSFTDFLIV